jgi:hypothetical protein
MDGLVAVAHLGGKFGMRKFLETSGEYNPSDANETKLSDYLNKFGNNEMDRLGFRYGGGADSGRGGGRGSRGPGRGSGRGRGQGGRGRDGGNPGGNPSGGRGGGNGRGQGGNNKQGQTPGGPGKGRETTKEKKERENREAENRREQARIASAAEAARVSQIKAREEKRRQDEEAANRREQARIASAAEAARLREIKAAKENRKERRDEGSTVSQVEQAFGPAFGSGSFGYGIYADPTSSTYNPKFNEHYGSGFSSLNYGDTQSILEGKFSEDNFTNEISIVDSIKDTIQDYTTFGEKDQLELQKFEGEGQGLQLKYNFKRGGLLDRGR